MSLFPYYEDLIASETALKHHIDNTPTDPKILKNLEALSTHILQPVFAHFKGQPDITSGYRCLALNRLLKSPDSSQHIVGEAVDFGIKDTDIREIAYWMDQNLGYDHLIIEKFNPNDLNKGWVHCSYKREGQNRHLFQNFDGKLYKNI